MALAGSGLIYRPYPIQLGIGVRLDHRRRPARITTGRVFASVKPAGKLANMKKGLLRGRRRSGRQNHGALQMEESISRERNMISHGNGVTDLQFD